MFSNFLDHSVSIEMIRQVVLTLLVIGIIQADLFDGLQQLPAGYFEKIGGRRGEPARNMIRQAVPRGFYDRLAWRRGYPEREAQW